MIIEGNKDSNTKFEIRSEYDGNIDQLRRWTLQTDNDFIEEWQADNKGNIHLVAQADIDSGYRVVLTPHFNAAS
ncbi:MAG: hypothetical protein DRQ44_03925 [Gammaproteobacteria bacterium]|nr:MAG: hypothetical protein DRQ44_03925 [Gammaproteobacteria bacterium]